MGGGFIGIQRLGGSEGPLSEEHQGGEGPESTIGGFAPAGVVHSPEPKKVMQQQVY